MRQCDEEAAFERYDFRDLSADTQLRLDAQETATDGRGKPGGHAGHVGVAVLEVAIDRDDTRADLIAEEWDTVGMLRDGLSRVRQGLGSGPCRRLLAFARAMG